MDNRTIDLRLIGKDDFRLAMTLAIGTNKTIGYRVHENTLVLYWTKSDKMNELPYAMSIEETIIFCWGWLENNKPSTPQPDHDGDNEKGFHVFTESWGHVFGEWQAFVGIAPIWAMYGK